MSRRNCIHPAAQRRRETASIIAYGDLRKALVSYLHTATASHNCWRPYNGTWLSIGQFPDLKMFPAGQEEIWLLVPPGIALVTIALRAVNWGLYHRSKRANDYAPLSVSEEDLTRSDDEENEHSLSINAALKDDGLGVYLLRLTRLFCVLGLLSFSVRELIVGNSSLWTRVAFLAFYVSRTATTRYPCHANAKVRRFMWKYSLAYPSYQRPVTGVMQQHRTRRCLFSSPWLSV